VATLITNITPLYNYAGTVTASCSGLPGNSLCRFQPVSLTFVAGVTTTQTLNVNIYTNVSSTIASLERRGGISFAELFGAPLVGLALLCMGRRRKMRLLPGLVLMLALAGGMMGLSGCGSSNGVSSTLLTPMGTSTVTVTYSDGAGNSVGVPVSFTVSAPYSLP